MGLSRLESDDTSFNMCVFNVNYTNFIKNVAINYKVSSDCIIFDLGRKSLIILKQKMTFCILN